MRRLPEHSAGHRLRPHYLAAAADALSAAWLFRSQPSARPLNCPSCHGPASQSALGNLAATARSSGECEARGVQRHLDHAAGQQTRKKFMKIEPMNKISIQSENFNWNIEGGCEFTFARSLDFKIDSPESEPLISVAVFGFGPLDMTLLIENEHFTVSAVKRDRGTMVTNLIIEHMETKLHSYYTTNHFYFKGTAKTTVLLYSSNLKIPPFTT